MLVGRSELIKHSPVVRFGVATVCVGIATVLTSLLWLIVDRPVSTPLFLAAIVLMTWAGGLSLGVYTAVIATVVFDYYFIQPYRDFGGGFELVIRLGVFFVQGGFMAW